MRLTLSVTTSAAPANLCATPPRPRRPPPPPDESTDLGADCSAATCPGGCLNNCCPSTGQCRYATCTLNGFNGDLTRCNTNSTSAACAQAGWCKGLATATMCTANCFGYVECAAGAACPYRGQLCNTVGTQPAYRVCTPYSPPSPPPPPSPSPSPSPSPPLAPNPSPPAPPS